MLDLRNNFSSKKLLIYGFGKSGKACLNYLNKKNNISIFDDNKKIIPKKLKNSKFINKVKINHEKGRSVDVATKIDKEKLSHLYTWHFIWSKFYYFSKHYGKLFTLIYFMPTLVRIILRMFIYKLIKSKKFNKYYFFGKIIFIY